MKADVKKKNHKAKRTSEEFNVLYNQKIDLLLQSKKLVLKNPLPPEFETASADWKLTYLFKVEKSQIAYNLLMEKYNSFKTLYSCTYNNFLKQGKIIDTTDTYEDMWPIIFYNALDKVSLEKITNPAKYTFSKLYFMTIDFIRKVTGFNPSSRKTKSKRKQVQIISYNNERFAVDFAASDSNEIDYDFDDDKKTVSYETSEFWEKVEAVFADNPRELIILKIMEVNPELSTKDLIKELQENYEDAFEGVTLNKFYISRRKRFIKEKLHEKGFLDFQPELTDRQKEILNILKADPKIKQRLLAEKFHVNESAISRDIKNLKIYGYLN